MVLYALFIGFAAVSVSYILAMWRLVKGSGISGGEWALDMISISAVVMIALLGVNIGI